MLEKIKKLAGGCIWKKKRRKNLEKLRPVAPTPWIAEYSGSIFAGLRHHLLCCRVKEALLDAGLGEFDAIAGATHQIWCTYRMDSMPGIHRLLFNCQINASEAGSKITEDWVARQVTSDLKRQLEMAKLPIEVMAAKGSDYVWGAWALAFLKKEIQLLKER